MRRAAGCSSGEVESWAPFWRGLEIAQITFPQIWSPFEDGNDATISKSLVCAIFVEVEPTLLLVIEEVKVLLGKFLLDYLLILASGKCGRAVDVEAFGIVSRCRLRIKVGNLSIFLILNVVDASILVIGLLPVASGLLLPPFCSGCHKWSRKCMSFLVSGI